jgi:hypothetical protein
MTKHSSGSDIVSNVVDVVTNSRNVAGAISQSAYLYYSGKTDPMDYLFTVGSWLVGELVAVSFQHMSK